MSPGSSKVERVHSLEGVEGAERAGVATHVEDSLPAGWVFGPCAGWIPVTSVPRHHGEPGSVFGHGDGKYM